MKEIKTRELLDAIVNTSNSKMGALSSFAHLYLHDNCADAPFLQHQSEHNISAEKKIQASSFKKKNNGSKNEWVITKEDEDNVAAFLRECPEVRCDYDPSEPSRLLKKLDESDEANINNKGGSDGKKDTANAQFDYGKSDSIEKHHYADGDNNFHANSSSSSHAPKHVFSSGQKQKNSNENQTQQHIGSGNRCLPNLNCGAGGASTYKNMNSNTWDSYGTPSATGLAFNNNSSASNNMDMNAMKKKNPFQTALEYDKVCFSDHLARDLFVVFQS